MNRLKIERTIFIKTLFIVASFFLFSCQPEENEKIVLPVVDETSSKVNKKPK